MLVSCRSRRSRWLAASLWLCHLIACEDDKDKSDDKSSDVSAAGEKGTSAGDGGRASKAGNGGAGQGKGGSGPDYQKPRCPVMVNDADCDRSKRPIVFVHGTVANGESFSYPALLLASNGYCADRIRAVEYNSLVPLACPKDKPDCPFMLDGMETYKRAKAAIDEAIQQLRDETGADKVDLLGHSQGAGHGAVYTRENPDKVAHYIHLAGGQLESDPGDVPTLCLSSTGDTPRQCKTTKNFVFQDDTLDHAAVASSSEAFVEIYKFLNDDKAPDYTTVQCGSPITLEGRAPTFGDNTFLPGSKVEVYVVGENVFSRGAPVRVFNIGDDGKFGPWEAKPDVAYEFKLIAPTGDKRKPRHAYLKPFVRSDRLLRFNFESMDPVASATGKKVNYNDHHSVIVARRRQKAFLFGRDSLTIDGFEALSEENAKARNVVCALYLYDAATGDMPGPGDGMSSGKSIISGTFLNSADVFIPTDEVRFVEVKFGDTVLHVQDWGSATQGMSIVLVD